MTDPLTTLREALGAVGDGFMHSGMCAVHYATPAACNCDLALREAGYAALAQVETLIQAAREPIDIEDDEPILRCRLCWVAWGNHKADCALAPFTNNTP